MDTDCRKNDSVKPDLCFLRFWRRISDMMVGGFSNCQTKWLVFQNLLALPLWPNFLVLKKKRYSTKIWGPVKWLERRATNSDCPMVVLFQCQVAPVIDDHLRLCIKLQQLLSWPKTAELHPLVNQPPLVIPCSKKLGAFLRYRKQRGDGTQCTG